jgi:hypothetical protein
VNGPPGHSKGGPLTTDRPTAENPGEELTSDDTRRPPQDAPRHAQAERDAGGSLADEAAGRWWQQTADAAIEAMAARGLPFTADDLVEVTGLPEATSPRAMGARFLSAARSGVIVQAGYATSRRRGARCAVVRVWLGAEAPSVESGAA